MAKSNEKPSLKDIVGVEGSTFSTPTGNKKKTSGKANKPREKKASTRVQSVKGSDWKPWRVGHLYEYPENQDADDLKKSNEAYNRLSGGKKS